MPFIDCPLSRQPPRPAPPCPAPRRDTSQSSFAPTPSPGRPRHRLAAAQPRAAILLSPDWLPPPAVCEIPGDRLAQTGLDRLARPPAELALQFAGIHRIAQVMAGPVRDKGYQIGMRPVRRV